MGRITNTKKVNATWRQNAHDLGALESSTTVRDVRVHTLPTMRCGVEAAHEYHAFTGNRRGREESRYKQAISGAMQGCPDVLRYAMDEASHLLDAAIAHEPRLAKRLQWVRDEDGIFADAGLVASGDDSPCYRPVRRQLADEASSGEPINICISTDSSTPGCLPAAIATIRIVQQFRPIRVYWQSAWLRDDRAEAGYIFLVPLITNDWDYARIQYVLSDNTRDFLGFVLLHKYAVKRDKINLGGLGRPAKRAYLDGGAHFIPPEGIRPDAESIAHAACEWLGMETPVWKRINERTDAQAALQRLPAADSNYVPPTDEEREENARYWKEQIAKTMKEEAAKAEHRLGSVGQ